MDRFEDMRCFLQVVETQSVTKAADIMGLAPSAVSRRLKELERRLGVTLMTRTTRRMSLTEAGQIFAARAEQVLGDLEEAEAEVSDAAHRLTGTLRVAAPLSFGLGYMTPIVIDFMRDNPGLLVELDLSDRHVDLVAEGLDLAVRIGRLRDSSLIARKVADVATFAAASPEFLDTHGRPKTPEDLADLPALSYVGSTRIDAWEYTAPDGTSGSVPLNVRMRANNGNVLCDAACRGVGIVLQPEFICASAIASGQLEVMLPDYTWPAVTIYTVYPQTRHLSAKARAFMDFVRKRIGSEPVWTQMD
ncbi:LysR family transcriptional regulator [Rhodobacteraceae bacterium NNCM2]|nr:LysR family transcriptional regulator [Coraliihabitans acroporae]